MKYSNRLEVYKNSTGTNTFNPIMLQAKSYNWWIYVAKINGKLVFNNYYYSSTTCQHQYKMRKLMRELNLREDLIIQAPQGLQDLDGSIKYYESLIAQLETEIAKPRSQKAKNIQRSEMVQYYFEKINQIKGLMV